MRRLSVRDDTWENTLLQELGRVERVQVRFGRQVRSWYLSGKDRGMLDRMGYKKRLK